MYQYFISVFESPSDQARLVTTIIAAIIAVAVVLLNQWFNSNRARKEKIIEKIEETFNTSISMQEAMTNLTSEIINNFDEYATNRKLSRSPMFRSRNDKEDTALSIFKEVVAHGEKMLMLSELYFPSIKEHILVINQEYPQTYKKFISAKSLTEYRQVLEEHSPIIESEFKKLSNELTLIMNKTMH